jgi:hypothetical protein
VKHSCIHARSFVRRLMSFSPRRFWRLNTGWSRHKADPRPCKGVLRFLDRTRYGVLLAPDVSINSSKSAKPCAERPASRPSGIKDWPWLRILRIRERGMTSSLP